MGRTMDRDDYRRCRVVRRKVVCRALWLLGLLVAVVVGSLSGCGHERVKPDAAGTDPYAVPAERANSFVWPEGKRAVVSLTFDDARLSQADVGIPLLDSYGIKATFYVSPQPLKERLPLWKQAVANGHEIGNHSLRHPCTGNFAFAREKALEDYTLRQMEQELEAANATIESALGVRPATFAYPCGQKFVGRGRHLKSYVPLVAAMFSAGRGWMDESTNDPAFCDPAQLLGMELDGLDFAQAKKIIDTAIENGAWLVFAGHEIGAGGRQTTRTDTLKAICEYARDPDNGIWIDTVENVARYVRNVR
jgi:peptidoglycan-N-acetylglucosamine deacetylase